MVLDESQSHQPERGHQSAGDHAEAGPAMAGDALYPAEPSAMTIRNAPTKLVFMIVAFMCGICSSPE